MTIQDLKRFIGRIQKNRLRSLLQAAAESLTGLDVRILLEENTMPGFIGEAYLLSPDFAVIKIDPIIDLESFYDAFLHEVGHVHLGHAKIRTDETERFFVDLARQLKARGFSGLMRLPAGEIEAYRAQPDEQAANSFSYQIGNYSREKSLEKFGDDRIETRLKVLGNTRILEVN